ncbi:MAG: hypothetical protein KA715_05755 [Xanthomonadaceae bacterium]|nr:hypothetical protein [Xanthomonadaceae bacterium]
MKLYTRHSVSMNESTMRLWTQVVTTTVGQFKSDHTKKSLVIYGPHGTDKEEAAKAIFKALANNESVLMCTTSDFFVREATFSQVGYEYIFIDGVDHMDDSAQTRFYQYTEKHSNVKVLVGSTDKLEVLVQSGKMKRELYEVISQTQLTLNEITSRGEGVNVWAKAVATAAFKKAGKNFNGFSPEAEKIITGYEWNGNDSEMESIMMRAAWSTNSNESVTSRDLGIISAGGGSTGGNIISINRPKFDVVVGGKTTSPTGETVVEDLYDSEEALGWMHSSASISRLHFVAITAT